MKLPNGFPIRSLTEKEYYDDIDDCLEVSELEPGEQYTLRVITSRRKPFDYAVDYPVALASIETDQRYDIHPYPYETHEVAFHLVSAEGLVLPGLKRARILECGHIYSALRLALSFTFKSGHDGYFVGSDGFDNEWLDLQCTQPIGSVIDAELVTV